MWPFSSKKAAPSAPETRVVTDRVFVLGLDQLYREAMKRREKGELLACAERVATALVVPAANVPLEGYYGEDPGLTRYFLLMRALQDVEEARKPEVSSLPEFRRLLEVSSSTLFGRAVSNRKLLPAGRDPLSEALQRVFPSWDVPGLVESAARIAEERDDASLVGIAARTRDAVLLAATRESVVLYAEIMATGWPSTPAYEWRVSDAISAPARRFVRAFAELFGESLPAVEPASAEAYWVAATDAKIVGRCVRIAMDPSRSDRNYHWAIRPAQGAGAAVDELVVQEFWAADVWTTDRYRAKLAFDEAVRAR